MLGERQLTSRLHLEDAVSSLNKIMFQPSTSGEGAKEVKSLAGLQQLDNRLRQQSHSLAPATVRHHAVATTTLLAIFLFNCGFFDVPSSPIKMQAATSKG